MASSPLSQLHNVVEAHAMALSELELLLSIHLANKDIGEMFQPRGSLSVTKLSLLCSIVSNCNHHTSDQRSSTIGEQGGKAVLVQMETQCTMFYTTCQRIGGWGSSNF